MTKFRYITEMGMLYRLSPAKWRKFNEARAAGDWVDLSDYGTCMAGFVDVTDWSATDAEMELAA